MKSSRSTNQQKKESPMAKSQSHQIRQGDVFVERVPPPRGVQPESTEGQQFAILARGEATGHHHSVPLSDAAILARGAERFLRVTSRRATLGHQEHAPLQLRSGTYEITIQREYTPAEIRTVLD